ncbi:hypothetical protein LTR85_008385 [Meristemomyces frigidus]|nr:hypothetical protein LTR85_008385 [Meristemomyces frigidus]
MATFEDLTAELVDLVVSHLNEAGLCAFRLASRESYERSYREFTNRVLGLRWMIAPHSLSALQSISKDRRLGPKLKTLRIGTHYFQNDGPSDQLANDLANAETDDERLAVTKRISRFQEYYDAQDRFRHGDNMATLAMILANLPALDIIEIGERYEGAGDDFTPCYGMTTFYAETGTNYSAYCHPDPLDGGDHGLTHNFKLVLRALSLVRSEITTLSASQYHPDPDHGEPWGVDVNAMPPVATYYAQGLKTAFANLRTLNLFLEYRQLNFGEEPAGWRQWLPDFVLLAPHLQNLNLAMEGWSYGDYPPPIPFTLLAFETFANTVHLPNLTTVELSNMAVQPLDLLVFWEKHARTLSNITLRRLLLTLDTWLNTLRSINSKFGACWTAKLAWLMEGSDHTSDESNVLLFSCKGFGDCKQCINNVGGYNMNECEHICKTIGFDEVGILCNVEKVPMESFCT